MRFKEFKEEVEKLGFYADDYTDRYYVDNDKYQTIVEIDNRITFGIDTIHNNFYQVRESDPEKAEKLYKLCIVFAGTPINKREGEKKYYLKHKWIGPYSLNKYINFDSAQDQYLISDVCETGNYKTQFTEKEIEGIKERFGVTLEDFEWVEVE